MLNPHKPYYDLARLPPNTDLESKAVLKRLVSASQSLAELSATANSLPNQAALYQSVILLEAKASSEIEQIITTFGDLLSGDNASSEMDAMTKEVSRYGHALQEGLFNERPLCPT